MYLCMACGKSHRNNYVCPHNKETSTLEKQVGGDHYKKMKYQPWEIISGNGYDFFEGNALAYIMRWKEKNGCEDLDKAIHYLEHMKELAKQGHYGEVKCG